MPPRKEKVNVYTATKTKLMSLQGVGVQTVDYIWVCRKRHLVIDAAKVAKMSPRSLKVLDFTKPEGYDSDSACSDKEVKQSTPERKPTDSSTVESDQPQREVQQPDENAVVEVEQDEEGLGEVNASANASDETQSNEETSSVAQDQNSDGSVTHESSSHLEESLSMILSQLKNIDEKTTMQMEALVNRTLPEMIKKEFKELNLVGLIRQEIMHQNISATVRNKENTQIGEQVSVLSTKIDEMNHTLCSLQQEVRSNSDQTKQQMKDLSEITFRNNDRIAMIESNMQDLHNHMASVEERVGNESELLLHMQEAQQMCIKELVDERVAELVKSIEDQSSDLQQLHMDIAYVNEKVIGLENKTTLIKEPPFTSTPRNATDAPSLPSTVHTDMNQKPTIISRGMTTTANPPQNVVNRGMTITADPQSHFGMGATYPIGHQQVHQAMPYPDSQQTTQAMPQQTNPVMQAYPPLWNMFSMPPPHCHPHTKSLQTKPMTEHTFKNKG